MHFVTSLAKPDAWAQWTWTFVLELFIINIFILCIVKKLLWKDTYYGMLSAQVH